MNISIYMIIYIYIYTYAHNIKHQQNGMFQCTPHLNQAPCVHTRYQPRMNWTEEDVMFGLWVHPIPFGVCPSQYCSQSRQRLRGRAKSLTNWHRALVLCLFCLSHFITPPLIYNHKHVSPIHPDNVETCEILPKYSKHDVWTRLSCFRLPSWDVLGFASSPRFSRWSLDVSKFSVFVVHFCDSSVDSFLFPKTFSHWF